nr:MAG TPA: hypothetical protein [Caudoviricetes sp.]
MESISNIGSGLKYTRCFLLPQQLICKDLVKINLHITNFL